MRVYDFRCEDCGAAFEAFLRSLDEARECPHCGSSRSSPLPTLQVSIGGRRAGRGRVIDLSSGTCPCGGRAARGSSQR